VLLAVVGPRWTGAGPDGKARINDDADPVRVEIEAALRAQIAIIPLLVDGATMPGAADLPESIQDFAFINAAPVDSGRDFRAHMERVIRSLDEILVARSGAKTPAPAAVAGTDARARRRRRIATISIPAVLIILAVIGFALAPQSWFGAGPPQAPTPAAKSDAAKPDAGKLEAKGKAPPSAPPPAASPATTAPSAAPPAPPPPAATPPTYRVLANVSGGVQNLRKGPALKYPIVVAIPAGATGIVLGECRRAEDNTRPWCAATWREHSGFISSCCIVDETTGAPPKVP
jgi:hypothetical protein